MGRRFLPRPTCKVCGAICKSLGRTFCSNKCKSDNDRGKPRPDHVGNKYNFKGDNVSVWAHYKRMQTLCPSGPCSNCGSIEKTLIHHVDHKPFNTIPSNLVRLCRHCHMVYHYAEIRSALLNKSLKKRV